MLEKIKSKFFIINLFTFLEDEKILKMIIHNKNLQNLLKINIINYKFLSGKYIVFVINGKGKIYNAFNDNLLFEGEFIKGRKNEWE